MIIPVRVAADMPLSTVGGVRQLAEGHPLCDQDCPVCDELLGSKPMTLVYVGTQPEYRQATGYVTGTAVAVHAACAGLDADNLTLS
ncbi:hypothetical protein [Streptacidiphilus albus]|uniref:hypothetical protein n=1 Tax=Streptacidiphilus albus TaxID=105425 RepID=UPI00054B77B0|nr:hypothetical protein [Streptacidiphilus albus]